MDRSRGQHLLTDARRGRREEFKSFARDTPGLQIEPISDLMGFPAAGLAQMHFRDAEDAVQIRGASGCHACSPVSRYYRDAKIMETIEGTTQIHEDILGKIFVDRAGSLDKS